MKYESVLLDFDLKALMFDLKTLLKIELAKIRFRMTDNRSAFYNLKYTFATEFNDNYKLYLKTKTV